MAANKLVRFDRVTLAWITANRSDISALKASIGSGKDDDAPAHRGFTGIHARIERTPGPVTGGLPDCLKSVTMWGNHR